MLAPACVLSNVHPAAQINLVAKRASAGWVAWPVGRAKNLLSKATFVATNRVLLAITLCIGKAESFGSAELWKPRVEAAT